MTEYSNTEVTDSTYDVETLPTPAPEANDYDKLIFVENQLLRIFVKRIQIMDGLYLLGPGQGQAVVQMARYGEHGPEFAIKFFVRRSAFDEEAEIYRNRNTGLGQHQDTLLLPECRNIDTNSSQAVCDPEGVPLPPYIVLERGESLDMWSERCKPDIWQAVGAIRNVAERLAALHQAGYVHRDLKPANIMWLPRKNRWTVIDYGCVAQTDSLCPPAFSLPWAAPEVVSACNARTLMKITPALDAWSLGVLLYELLTGRRWCDFFAEGIEQVQKRILAHDGLKLPWEETPLPAEDKKKIGVFRRHLLALLSRNPSSRPTMQQFAGLCDSLLESNSIVVEHTTSAHGKKKYGRWKKAMQALLSRPAAPRPNIEHLGGVGHCQLPSNLHKGIAALPDAAARNILDSLGAQLMPHPLPCLSSCTWLKVTNISIGCHIQHLAHVLPQLHALRGLEFQGNAQHIAEAHILWPHLASLKQLTGLCLGYNDLGAEGAGVLESHLSKLTQLQALSIDNNSLCAAGAKVLGTTLAQLTQLRRLGLGSNNFGAEGAKVLGPSLAQLTQLQVLSLSSNDFRVKGAKVLGTSLTVLTQLQKLYLDSNNFGAEGAKVLGPHLTVLTQLQKLYLDSNNFGAEGAKVLGPCLAVLTQLQVLDLGSNNFGADGAKVLGPSLAQLTQLQKLGLSYNCFDAEGAKVLAKSLASFQHLSELYLRGNNFNAADAIMLNGIIRKLPVPDIMLIVPE